MINLRILVFLFLFCFDHKCVILDAANTKPATSNVCSNSACKYASSIIQQYMNPQADPCDDFNQFVCGSFLKNAQIAKGKRRTDRYDIVLDKIQENLKRGIEETIKPNEPKWLKLAKNYYKACMNTAAIEKNRFSTLLSEFEKLGGWPVLKGESWKEKTFDWKNSTYTMEKLGYGTNYFFTFSVITDPLNRNKRVLNIDSPALSIDREHLIKGSSETIVTAYYNYMVDMAVMFGANKARAEKELKESLEFEIKLAKIAISEGNKRMTVQELSKTYPSIPWKEYFNTIFSILKSSIVIGDKEVIMVSAPTFFAKFEGLIKDKPRVLANYHLWRAAQDDFNYLNDEIRKRQLKFQNLLSGRNETQALRWTECLDATSGVLGPNIGALYVRKYFNLKSKISAEKLVVDIEKEYKKIIQEAAWMDQKTKSNTLTRLASINNFIGFPYELLDDKVLNEFFKKVEITANDYFQASTNMSLFYDDYFFNLLRTPVNTSYWFIHSQTAIVGPFFSIEGRGPEIPAGILQDTFYDEDFPLYMNYGGMGTFNMGHEITHFFDDLDAYMTPETKQKYLQNADCITKQYGNYTVKELGRNLNGSFTQRENINDNAGVKVAYLAYQDWVKQNGPEPKLVGLTNFTQSQLFWITAALTQCDKYTLDFLKQIVASDVHSPSGFRIIGTVSNRPEFARDFNCKLGTKMNPVKKCSVW